MSTESVFDQSFNNLFAVPVAGNVLGTPPWPVDVRQLALPLARGAFEDRG